MTIQRSKAPDDPVDASTHPDASAGFTVDRRWVDQKVVVAVSGDLDMLTAPWLSDAIRAATAHPSAGVIVDLSTVEFLASAGINALITAYHDITPPTRFGVVTASAATRRPLTILGLDSLLNLYQTLDAALDDVTDVR